MSVFEDGISVTFGGAAFVLVRKLMQELSESGQVPESVVFDAIKKAVDELEQPAEDGTIPSGNKAMAEVIRGSFPTAMNS